MFTYSTNCFVFNIDKITKPSAIPTSNFILWYPFMRCIFVAFLFTKCTSNEKIDISFHTYGMKSINHNFIFTHHFPRMEFWNQSFKLLATLAAECRKCDLFAEKSSILRLLPLIVFGCIHHA